VVLDPRITNDVSNTLNDQFQAAYFSVNRIYRQSPKCGWAMADKTWQWIRSLTDKQGRPLLNISKDDETLMGKRVLITPSMPEWVSSTVDGKIVFGDFSRLMVRTSRLTVTRNLQAPGYVEFGKGLYTGRMRADAKVVDPTGGAVPPFTYITLEA
jgi:HK97 family phage major capsid protein